MKHLGDITKINGAEIEPVHCIIGGSPCQDLSIAGKRAGLSGERSGLFMHQVRIVKEMREKYGAAYPRFMVWENVPGALSSNKGADFAAVLTEIIRIIEPEAPGVDVPAKGWSTWGGFRDMDGRWSVAWRVHDAQYWGVPQRRRRIALVADFGGDTASEILFERNGLSGDIAESGASGQRFAEAAEAGASYAVRIRGGCDGGGKGALVQEDKSGTLGCGNDQTIFCLQGNGIDRADTAGCNGRGWCENVGYTLNTVDRHAVAYGISAYESNAMRSANPHSGVYEAYTSRTLDLNGGNPACNQGGICIVEPVGADLYNAALTGDTAATLTASACKGGGASGPSVLEAQRVKCLTPWESQSQRIYDADGVWHSLNANENGGMNRDAVLLDMSHACDVIRECGKISPSLQARMGTGGNQVPLTYSRQAIGEYKESRIGSTCSARDFKDSTDLVCAVDCRNFREGGEVNGTVRQNMVVRRLTPTECERLQGFPDGWTDIGDYTDSKGKKRKTSDSARYKALGNSIALPFWQWMLRRMCEISGARTMGSLFDGIGGFPLCWERINGNGSCRWASEIEEFPIAVTKRHFKEE